MTLRTVGQHRQFLKLLAKGARKRRKRPAPPITKAQARKLCAEACANHPITRIKAHDVSAAPLTDPGVLEAILKADGECISAVHSSPQTPK